MKKIWKSIAVLSCAAILCTGLTACETDKEIINAYDIAVKNGFIGTEAQWLASLKGADGKDAAELDVKDVYAAAVAEGYTGTFLEFLKEYLSADVTENNDTETLAQNVSSVMSVNCAFRTTKTYTNNRFPYNRETVTQASGSAGSAVVIDLDKTNGNALVITNYHVIYSAGTDTDNDISDCIYLYPYGARNGFTSGANTSGVLSDVNGNDVADANDQGDFGGDGIRASFVGGAMDYDIALLQVSGSEYLKNSAVTEAVFGDSDKVTVGEKAYAIGNANGEGISVTSGVVSVDSENIVMTSSDGQRSVQYRVMRTDAAINHGNSGGALFNAHGELIGITNAKNVEDETDNMGYALPITQVKYLVENMQANGGVVKRAWLGIQNAITASSAKLVNGKLTIVEECTVAEVLSDGDKGASYGLLKVGDVLKSVTVNGETKEITRSFILNDMLLKVRKGDSATLKVVRDGTETDVTVTFDKDEYFKEYK